MHSHALNDPTDLQAVLAVLAAPRRFDLLLLMLAGANRSVSQLAEAVGLSQSCTTRHLQALARAGLVAGARDGKRVVFRVAPRDAAARAVLASITAGQASAPSDARARADRRSPRPAARRPGQARPRPEAQRAVLEAAIRIESAAEFEPLMPDPGAADDTGDVAAQPSAESGTSSGAPEAIPAWQRSDLEDFLL
jgi:DNA-binding transcriptional ArsR family regulator